MKFNIYKTTDNFNRSFNPPCKNAVAVQNDDYITSTLRGSKWEVEITTLEDLLSIFNECCQSKYTEGIILTTDGEPNEYTLEIYDGYRE